MQARRLAYVAMLLALALQPCMARTQQTPQDILKKAIARVARATTYQTQGRMEIIGFLKGTPSMQFRFIRSDEQYRMEMTKLTHPDGLQHDNVRLVTIRDGEKYWVSVTGAPQGSYAYVGNDGKNFLTSSSFLPSVKEVERWTCKLRPAETVDGKVVSPITVYDNDVTEDKVGTTYYIEQGTYRLTRISRITKKGESSAITSNGFAFVFDRETLNGQVQADAFTIVLPTKAKEMTAPADTSNPLSLALDALIQSRAFAESLPGSL